MYQASQAGAESGAAAGDQAQKNEDVVDADFEEVDDDDQKKSA
jgi:molecular chaperone DnaK